MVFPFEPLVVRGITLIVAIILLSILFYAHLKAIRVLNIIYPPLGKGEVLIHRINNEVYEDGKREVRYKVPKNVKEIQVEVSFQGKLTNGFFDSLIYLTNRDFFYCPDRLTYYNDFYLEKVKDELRLTLYNFYDTGIIQGKWDNKNLRLIFKFPIRIGGKYGDVGIPLDVRKIIIGVYEDPTYSFALRGRLPKQYEEVRLPVSYAKVELV